MYYNHISIISIKIRFILDCDTPLVKRRRLDYVL